MKTQSASFPDTIGGLCSVPADEGRGGHDAASLNQTAGVRAGEDAARPIMGLENLAGRRDPVGARGSLPALDAADDRAGGYPAARPVPIPDDGHRPPDAARPVFIPDDASENLPTPLTSSRAPVSA